MNRSEWKLDGEQFTCDEKPLWFVAGELFVAKKIDELIEVLIYGDLYAKCRACQFLTILDTSKELNEDYQQKFYAELHRWKNTENLSALMPVPNETEWGNREKRAMLIMAMNSAINEINFTRKLQSQVTKFPKINLRKFGDK